MLEEIVEVLVCVRGRRTDGADWVAVVAVVEEDVGVGVKAFKMFWAARTGTIVVYAATDGKVLVTRTDDRAKGHCCNN